MLSPQEFNVLALIDSLQQVSTDIEADDQVKVVIDELAKLSDEVESSELMIPSLTPASQNSVKLRVAQQKDFINLCFRRLRSAQVTAEEGRRRRWKEQQIKQEMPKIKPVPATNETESAAQTSEQEKDKHLSKSEDITATLRRIHQMAQGEVIKSDLNVSELDMSSRTLRKLQEKYSSADILLNGSRKLIQVLDEADAWDRRKMLASLSLLGAVLMWIIWRRLLQGPVLLMLWGFLRLFGVAKYVSSPLRGLLNTEPLPSVTTALHSALSTATESVLESTPAADTALETTIPLVEAVIDSATSLAQTETIEPALGSL